MNRVLFNALKLKEKIPEGQYAFKILKVYFIRTNNENIVRLKIKLKHVIALFYDLELNDNNVIYLRNFFKILGFKVINNKAFKPEWNNIIGREGYLYLGWYWYISADGVVGYSPEITWGKYPDE